MKFLFTFLLLFLFLSFNAFSGITVTNCIPSSTCQLYNADLGYCGDNIEQCKASFDGRNTIDNGTFYVTTLQKTGADRWYAKATRGDGTRQGSEFYVFITDTGTGCHSREECYQQALRECSSISQLLKDFNYLGSDSDPQFTKQCSTQKTEQEKCEETIIAQCVNNFGASKINLNDDGLGNSICSGICTDGTNAEEVVYCQPTRQNNYCDTPDAASELDFSNGFGGSDIDENPLSGKTPKQIHDNEYVPDGSNPDAPQNIVLDSLINAVNQLNNENTEITDNTASANRRTIVEKSDDIIQSNEKAINSLIDETKLAAFNDVNIVGGLNELQDDLNRNTDNLINAINGLGSNSGDNGNSGGPSLDDTGIINAIQSIGGTTKVVPSGNLNTWGDFVNLDAVAGIQAKTLETQTLLETKITNYQSQLSNLSSITPSTGSYSSDNLDLGKWGSHDISISRFSSYFTGVGTVLYLLASIFSLYIVLGSKR